MKLLRILLIVLLASCAPSVQAQTERFSSIWEPLDKANVPSLIRKNSQDPVALHQLWWRARTQDAIWYYVIALHRVVKEQPSNTIASSAYAYVLLDCLQNYSSVSTFKRAKADLGDDLTPKGVRKLIERIKEQGHEQWLADMAESNLVAFEGKRSDEVGKESEALALRAVKLSPNSITNSNLAYIYLCRAARDDNPEDINRSIKAAKQAQNLAPTYPQASALLLYIYQYEQKNPGESQNAKLEILKSINPDLLQVKLNIDYLKQLGIEPQ